MTTAGSTSADEYEELVFTIQPLAVADPAEEYRPWLGILLVLVVPVALAVLVFIGLELL